MKSVDLGLSSNGFIGMGYVNAQLTLPKDLRITAMGQYQSRWIMLQGTQSALFFTNVAVNRDFLKKKMTVSLTCNSPFSKDLKMTSTTAATNYASKGSFHNPMREVRLSISYRFGTMKEAIKKVQRGISNDDVKGGGGGGEGGGSGAGG
jgi:hypothetical protein